MTFKLRDYQLETITNIVVSMKQGNKSIMVQQPPRTGKTVIMAEIARRTTENGGKVLFIVHRKEIVEQVVRTFEEQDVNMDLAQIGMVQTFTRHVSELHQPDVIFVDEAHHVLAKSYRRILDAFPKAIKLLFTATPWRMSGKGFEEVADDLLVGKSIRWLIDNGHLAPINYYAPKQIDTNVLKTKRNGEFDEASITEAIKPKIYGNAVKTYQKLASGKQAIAYAYNVYSAELLAQEFNKVGIAARAVSGKTDKKEREQIIRDYRAGKIQIVANAELFTEGLDLPNVDCVIMLRPTKSLSLFLQFSMRAMNPRKGKTAVLIDHVANVERFGLPIDERDWQLDGTSQDKTATQSASIKGVTVCAQCFGTFYRTNEYCPYCNHLLTKEETIKTDEQIELEKVELKRSKRLAKQMMQDNLQAKVADKSPKDLNSFQEISAYGKLHGYKPGWAYFYAKKRGFRK